MFSGIVQQTSRVTNVEHVPGLARITLDLAGLTSNLKQGASVSVGGVCLTVAAIKDSHITFEMIGETLDKTTLGSLKIDDHANIERSIRAEDEIGGHRVSGHITGTAEIIKVDTPSNNHILTIRCPAEWMDFVFPKGFIALDGCSLTVVDVGDDWFTVHLIPETLRLTTFGQKTVGDRVNLELDPMTQTIVATVRRYLDKRSF
ncbi:MAG: riboflavin synthase subunit alpha [Candidatus Uhrbacteria bacterium]|nr:riboflavin synthase subunit alpha [Candidatus Uhrbacteria bacterium]